MKSEPTTQELKQEIALLKKKLSEDKYKDYFEKDISGVYRSTPQGKLLDCNQAFAKMLGYSISEIKKISTKKLYPKTGNREAFINNIMENRNLFNKEIDLIKKDGQLIHCIENVVGIFNNNDELIQFQGYIFDITQRKEAEIALAESEARFKRLFEDLGDAVYVTIVGGIRKGDILEANQAAVNQTGYSKKELLKMNIINDLFISGTGNISTEDWDKKLEDGDTTTVIEKKRKKDGSEFWTEVIVTPIEFKGHKASLSINHDITNRIIAKQSLEESEKKFRELFEQSGDAFLIIKNRIFIDCNKAALNMLKFKSKNDFTNVHPSVLSPEFQPDGKPSIEKAEEMMQLCIEKGTHRFEWNHTKQNGEVFPVEVLLTAISSEPGNEIIHTVWRDITERWMNQKELIKAKEKAEESDRLKSAFLANMSHEIRTPMNGILGFASLLKLPDLNKEQLTKYVAIIEKSGHRMLNIINDVMDISKIESGQMEVNIDYCNVNEQIEYLYSFFKPETEREELELSYTLSLSDEEATILTDNEKLYAILANLIKNSIKYSDDGEINFGYKKKNDNLIFHITDSGIGIPKERQKAVFERFVQADIEDKKAMEGAGLGLAIAKAYVEMLGGDIWLESEEGKGTTFFFTIPYNPLVDKSNGRSKVSKTGIENNVESKKLKILIAEDEEFSKNYLQIILKDLVENFLHAKTGREAIDICKNNTDLDLILMDIKMPIMGGYEATKEIRKFNNSIIIIAQTAYALPGDKEKATEAGCNEYISKPIDKDELIKKIEFFFN